jgi:choice-of-anchor A domain-containing protein
MKATNGLLLALLAALALPACGKSVHHTSGLLGLQEPPGDEDPNDPGAGHCDPSSLGEALAHSVYVREGAKLEGSKVRKKVAGVDVALDSTHVGFSFSPDKSRVDLTASRDLDLLSSKVLHGRAIYGGAVRKEGSTAYGGFARDEEIDLGPGWSRVLSFSRACSFAEANATAERICECADGKPSSNEGNDPAKGCEKASPKTCRLVITGSHAGLNLARVSDAQVAGVDRIEIDMPSTATLVATFPDLKTERFVNTKVKIVRSFSIDRVYWNLPEAATLGFEATQFFGTVVAPWAAVSVVKNDGTGAFWSESADVKQSVF